MTQMNEKLSRTWQSIVRWFEYGDLVPLIVIVSAVHYSMMLQAYDQIFVAIAIGLMVDLGHFRTVRAAVRYNGSQRRTAALRWIAALFFTLVSIVYQQRYYNDFWLSLPLPLLIVALAWLQHTDKPVVARQKKDDKPKPAPVKTEPTNGKADAKMAKKNVSAAKDYAKMTIEEIMKVDGVSRRTAYRRKSKPPAA